MNGFSEESPSSSPAAVAVVAGTMLELSRCCQTWTLLPQTNTLTGSRQLRTCEEVEGSASWLCKRREAVPHVASQCAEYGQCRPPPELLQLCSSQVKSARCDQQRRNGGLAGSGSSPASEDDSWLDLFSDTSCSCWLSSAFRVLAVSISISASRSGRDMGRGQGGRKRCQEERARHDICLWVLYLTALEEGPDARRRLRTEKRRNGSQLSSLEPAAWSQMGAPD